MEITTFEHMLGEIKQEAFYGISTNCHSIQVSKDLCEQDKSNCQIARTNIDNAENSIELHMNTLYTMSRICELPSFPSTKSAISRCHEGKTWSEREDATQKFPFLSNMFESFSTELLNRMPRFVVSTAILISTAIGALSLAA